MTSHDAVFRLRKILRIQKIGHGGTLDPDVVGVLPIAVGKATRLIEFIHEEKKVYEGEVTLGFSTTTGDVNGDVLEETPIYVPLSEDEIDLSIESLTGTIFQVPPMYSAIKVNGKKLYEYARKNQTIERPIRKVIIGAFDRISPLVYRNQTVCFRFRVQCSKGTYIRTLIVDLGRKLGVASHMSQLIRIRAAGMILDESITLEEINHRFRGGDLSFFYPIEKGVVSLPKVELSRNKVEELRYGRFISLISDEVVLAGLYQGRLVAVLEKRGAVYKPKKVLI